VAPSDGVVCEAGVVSAGMLLEAKGSAFTLSDLLADSELAARLEGGRICDLPFARDYHRVHSPVSGRSLAGRTFQADCFRGESQRGREMGLFARTSVLLPSSTGPLDSRSW